MSTEDDPTSPLNGRTLNSQPSESFLSPFGSHVFSSPDLSRTGSTMGGSTMKRKKSTTNVYLAAEDAKQQLQLDGVKATADDDEEEDKKLSAHRSTLKESMAKAKQMDIAKSHEESELHKTVNKLMEETRELRGKLREETSARLAAEDKEATTQMKLLESDEESANLKTKCAALEAAVTELQKENNEYQEELANSRVQLMVNVAKRKSSKTIKVSVNAMGLVQRSEGRVREAIEEHEEDVRRTLAAWFSKNAQSASVQTEVRILRVERARLNQAVESLKSKVQTLEVASAHMNGTQHHHAHFVDSDSHSVSRSETGSRFGAASTVSRRSVSPKVASPPGNQPWYPPGRATGPHTPARAKSPRLGGALREEQYRRDPNRSASSRSPSTSSTHHYYSSHSQSPPRPTPTPRRVAPTPTATPRPTSSAPTPTPRRQPSRSPPRETMTKTLEHLTDLLYELKSWQEDEDQKSSDTAVPTEAEW